MKRKLLLFPLLLLFALALAPTAGATENDVYAILYADKTLVFQYGDAPESGREVTATYPVDLNGYEEYQIPWYGQRENIVTVIFASPIAPLSMAYWFKGFTDLQAVRNLDLIDTSQVNSMAGMFAGCLRFREMDLRGLDTSAVSNMAGMFGGCTRLSSLNVSGFDTSNATDMTSMFKDCSNLRTLDVGGFKTSKVENMASMFSGCSSLKTLDVSAWDAYRVANMGGMFYGCSALQTLDVSKWNTFHVKSMNRMFYGCSSLTELHFNAWNTSNVTGTAEMFYGCSNLKALNLSNFDTWNVTNMEKMFYNCSSLAALDVSNFDTWNVTQMAEMFRNCSSLETLDLGSFENWNAAGNMGGMFSDCSNLKTIYVSQDFVAGGASLFSGCTSLVGGAGTKFDWSHTGWEYARIDNPPDAPGYLTLKTEVRDPVRLIWSGSTGQTVSMEDLRNGAEIKPEISVPADADQTEWNIVEVFLAVYDSQGMMIDLTQWELDASKPAAFIRTYAIPQNKDAAYVKMMILSEGLAPLAAAQALQ